MLVGLADNTRNYKQGKIVKAFNEATGRYGVRVFGTTSPIAVKKENITTDFLSETLTTSALVGPFTSEGWSYSLSSDSVLQGDDQSIANYVDESTTKRLVEECPLGEIFLYNHKNLTLSARVALVQEGLAATTAYKQKSKTFTFVR